MRFNRASLRDLRRSFSTAEQSEVNETPESGGSCRIFAPLATTDEEGEQDGDKGGVRVETLEDGEMMESAIE